MSSNDLLVDKCPVCETYFAVTSSSDLQRRLNAHELEQHGKVNPSRVDHTATNHR